ncbi:hypothetical protein D3C75_991560 [compost metagenome]
MEGDNIPSAIIFSSQAATDSVAVEEEHHHRTGAILCWISKALQELISVIGRLRIKASASLNMATASGSVEAASTTYPQDRKRMSGLLNERSSVSFSVFLF